MNVAAPEPDQFPAAVVRHAAEEGAPTVGEYVPAGQGWQVTEETALSVEEYVPAAHFVHVVWPRGEYVPAGHGSGLAVALLGQLNPAGHCTWLIDLDSE